MSNQRQIREEITKKIIAALENDLLPWRRPWSISGSGRHRNAISNRPYSGVNPLLLELHSMDHGFTSRWWATLNQWHEMGCTVKKRPDHVKPGQWGCQVVLCRPVTKEVADSDTGDQEKETYWLLRRYTVFNADQVEGAGAERFRVIEQPSVVPDYEPAEELIEKSGAEIHFGGNHAFYRRPTPEGSFPNHTEGDYIQVPFKSSFVDGAYYATVLHELSHWSEVRVGWEHAKNGYAMGELVAEIGSCYLAAELNVPNDEPENHVAYLKSWLQAMKNDPAYIFRASSQASKVCDFLLSFVRQPEVETEELTEAA